MAKRPSRRDLSTGILIVLLAGVMVAQTMGANATHQPADKAAANGSKVVVIPAAPEAGTPILEATLKTSKPQDLVFSVTLECSIITQTYIAGDPNGTSDTEEAEGRIRVWVTIDDEIVPINSPGIGDPPSTDPNQESPAGDDTDKVTYCNRFQEQFVEDEEENEGGSSGNQNGDGYDTHRLYLRSKTANAFNWIYLNAGSDVHEVVVYADLVTNPATRCTGTEPPGEEPTILPSTTTCAHGYVGNRTLMVFPERFSNDAVV
jgi:hypothetical protein